MWSRSLCRDNDDGPPPRRFSRRRAVCHAPQDRGAPSLVIRLVGVDFVRAIDLLQQDHAHELMGYYQHVPLFSDVLDVVAGQAPLIVKYKFSNNKAWDERSEELMEKGHALLEAYDGPYVIESFHPGAVNWYKEHHPEVCRGQLSWPAKLSKNGAAEWAAGLLAFDWLSRPDFVAYDWTGGASPQVRLARSMGTMPVSWTVRSSDELAQCAPYFDRHIFEAFGPDAV